MGEITHEHHQAHLLSEADRAFRASFEANKIAPGAFHHRGHLRLAYIYLAEPGPGADTESAHARMRNALLGFLQHNGVDAAKYHETLTRSWILAVRHFMVNTVNASSADDFIDQNPRMLDAKIMLTHYSAATLFSDEARARFVEPDLDPIPHHAPRHEH